jgi:uncharacterized protein (TIGR04141 family)
LELKPEFVCARERAMATKTNKLKIYLIKPEVTHFDQIVDPEATSIEIPGVGMFYMENSLTRTPEWLADFFGDRLDAKLQLRTASARGLLLVRASDAVRERIFALTFGHGRHLLQNDVVEEHFGLKVVLNSVDEDSIRSIDKTTLGSIVKQSREQISREGPAASFGIDIEQDLVKAVSGRSSIEEFGKIISGKDCFSASAKFDAGNVSEVLKRSLERYRSNEYQKNFDWIDQIRELRSRTKLDELNAALVARIEVRDFGRIWLTPSEIVEWEDVKGFRYLRPQKGELYHDLAIPDLVSAAGEKPITLDWLRNSKVHLISARNDDVQASWPAFKCLYAELDLGGNLHILNNGSWYEIAPDFADQVNLDFANVPEALLDAPDYAHEDENAYNVALSEALDGSCCLDLNIIVHGGGKEQD